MVHLIAIVLGEFDIQPVLAQAQHLDAMCAKGLGNIHPKLGGSSSPDVQHQQCHWNGLCIGLRNAPDSSGAKFPDRHGDAANSAHSDASLEPLEPVQRAQRKTSGSTRRATSSSPARVAG